MREEAGTAWVTIGGLNQAGSGSGANEQPKVLRGMELIEWIQLR